MTVNIESIYLQVAAPKANGGSSGDSNFWSTPIIAIFASVGGLVALALIGVVVFLVLRYVCGIRFCCENKTYTVECK